MRTVFRNGLFLAVFLLPLVLVLGICESASAQLLGPAHPQKTEQKKQQIQKEQEADTLTIPDSLYFPSPAGSYSAVPFPRQRSGLIQLSLGDDKTVIVRDSSGNYVVQRQIAGMPATAPTVYTASEFKKRSLKNALKDNWTQLVKEANLKQEIQKGLLDFKINIPGGKKSAFTTIFGKPEVNLSVTGTANMNIGASITKTADPSLPPDQQKRVDPTFNQNLKLNIQGSIGDKLKINTDWDTERPFDYQNRLKIQYQGYEDEILKSIQLGNVSMETGNSLIRGGGALFGIKSEAKIGPLKVTTVLSQQQGKGNTQTITGGSQEQQIDIRPADYEDNKHFFVDPYSLENFESAVANPQIQTALYNFNNIKVYKLDVGRENVTDVQPGVAIVELGDYKDPVTGEYKPPDQAYGNLPQKVLDQVRSSNIDTLDVSSLAQELGIKQDRDIVKGTWIELQEGQDYTVNRGLGIISLTNALTSNEALAIAFDYSEGGRSHTVGDVQTLGQSVKILKLIRQPNITSESSTWDLTLRNIYSLGPTNLTQDGLDVGVYYTGQNTDSPSLPQFNSTLLTDLGLDRVNQAGQVTPDNMIDFIPPVMDAVQGKIMFPYLEPFGKHIDKLIDENKSITNKQEFKANLAFDTLYAEPQSIAAQDSKNSSYEIKGTAKGGASDTYNLGIALVEGSVKVYANGTLLTEGVDYNVDYSIGTIVITNKRYLASGQQIRIEYESNQILQIQQTTFTGIRAEYDLSNNIQIGGTYFRLKDKPLTDKIRIGDEPINNAMLGLDAHAKFNAPWLTRAIDHIPLLQTKAPSSISFSGEWAELDPGVAQTNAVSAAIKQGKLQPDEKKGLSYIDDFEGSKTSFSLLSPGRWHLAAAPAAIPGYDTNLNNPSETLQDKVNRSDLRGQFSWYMLPLNVSSILGIPRDRVTSIVKVQDVFPGRQTLPQENTIQPLDIYYDPENRGPYNYNMNLKNITQNDPQKMWGGMTTALPDGIQNLNLNNYEFIEFWVQPILPKKIRDNGPAQPSDVVQDYNGKLLVDVGTVSEDVIPNYTSNNEDGLRQLGCDGLVKDQTGRSYVLNSQATYDGQFSTKSQAEEDVGLDGIPDTGGSGGCPGKNEQTLFANFLDYMKQAYGADSPQYLAAKADPSNDDYDYYGESKLRQEYGTSSIQPYFWRMYGYDDGNSPPPTSDKRAITNRPDAEGLVIPSVPNYRDSYYEYQVNLDPADPNSLDPGQNFVVDRVEDQSHPGDYWYQVRIPLDEFKRKFGDIQDLQTVTHIRIWMTGYKQPFTLRFATLELVGNQWRKAQQIGNQSNTSTSFEVSTVDVEENSSRTPVPYREPPGTIRALNRTQQGNILANEQSLVMRVRDLRQGDLRMIRRNYPSALNLLNYSHLRMYVHGEGYRARKNLELVLRLGRDLQNDYYEYRQPITPTDTTLFRGETGKQPDAIMQKQANEIWLPDQNSVDLVLSALNQIKQLRNQVGADPNALYQDSTIAEELGAPPGTIIGVKGNPSLQKITEIGMGIENPLQLAPNGETVRSDVGVPSLSGELWVNELRVSGYDNKKGWAANAHMNVQLADFAQIDGTLNRTTDGFGQLDSHLGQRNYSNSTSYNLNTTVNLHKFFPERSGWYFPVSLNIQKSISTPRYLPREGDIRLSDFKQAVERRKIPQAQKDSIINQEVIQSQTYNQSYSINASNISKKNSKSKFLQYTLDKTQLSYVYNAANSHSPTVEHEKDWNYNFGINYNLNFNRVGLFQPFGFLGRVPLLNTLAGLRLGYMPSSISTSASLARRYSENQQRSYIGQPGNFSQIHTFDYRSQFALTYNLMPSIPINFSSSTSFNLADMGQTPDPNDSTRYNIVPTFDVLKNIVKGDSIKPRRSNYQESYSASWRPRLNQIQALNWLDYSVSYKGGWSWANTPKGSYLGANTNNNLNITQSTNIHFQDLLRRIPFYRNMVNADRKEKQERVRRKAIEKQKKEAERQAQKAGKEKSSPDQNGNTVGRSRPKGSGGGGNIFNDIKYYGRKLLLTAFSMESFDVSYSHNKGSQQYGYRGEAPIFQMFGNKDGSNFSPPFSYRTGFLDHLDELITNPDNQQSLTLSNSMNGSDNLSIRTRITPFPNFTIDLDWSANWSDNAVTNFSLPPGSNTPQNSLLNQTGNIGSSVWTFGKGYSELLKKQLATAQGDINGTSNIISDTTGNRDGRTVLTPASLTQDFKSSYLVGALTFGPHGFLPFPKPGWTIKWSGLESAIPGLDKYISHISLTHKYSGTYRVGWTYYNDTTTPITGTLGQYAILSTRRPYEANTINVEEHFSPLLGINITWKNNMTTNIEYTYAKTTSFSFTGPTTTVSVSKGLTVQGNYTKRGFKLPFFRSRLKNQFDVGVTLSYLVDYSIPYNLGTDLKLALQGQPLLNYANNTTGDSRLQFSTIFGYQFSSMIKANFEYSYRHVMPKSSNMFERTDQEIKFNIIVSIRSN